MHARSMELARHREEELGGSHGHLTELGVPEPFLTRSRRRPSACATSCSRARASTAPATGQQCYQACLADSQVGAGIVRPCCAAHSLSLRMTGPSYAVHVPASC